VRACVLQVAVLLFERMLAWGSDLPLQFRVMCNHICKYAFRGFNLCNAFY